MMIVLETAIEILKVRLHWPFLVRFVLRFSARVKQDVLKKRSSFKFQVYLGILTENLENCSRPETGRVKQIVSFSSPLAFSFPGRLLYFISVGKVFGKAFRIVDRIKWKELSAGG